MRFLDYSGEIRLGGKVSSKAITQETYKGNWVYLPEEKERSLMPKLTIFEQVRYLGPALKGMSTAEVKEKLPTWMEKLQVKGKLTDKIKSLKREPTEGSIDHHLDP